eukprot:scaffold43886_cov61-Phaeocystis_antarctica.AAC.3
MPEGYEWDEVFPMISEAGEVWRWRLTRRSSSTRLSAELSPGPAGGEASRGQPGKRPRRVPPRTTQPAVPAGSAPSQSSAQEEWPRGATALDRPGDRAALRTPPRARSDAVSSLGATGVASRVMWCTERFAAAAASRSGSCSLRGAVRGRSARIREGLRCNARSVHGACLPPH